MKYEVTCKFCDKHFSAKRPHAKFCSSECRLNSFFKMKEDTVNIKIHSLNERIKELEEENMKLKENQKRTRGNKNG